MKNTDEIKSLIEKESKEVKDVAEYIAWVIHDYFYGGHICNVITVYLDGNTYHEKPTPGSKEVVVVIDDYRSPEQIIDALK